MTLKRKRQDSPSQNPYVLKKPHFGELARQFPRFAPFVNTDQNGKPYIDFKDPDAVRTLTWCLLKRDFDLDVELPKNRLCPPVPNRLDYVIWIEDIIRETVDHVDIHGIDIGVGASCIYPLLACTRNANWKFDGTDINQKTVQIARGNVDKNSLNDRITVRLNDTPERIFMLEDGKQYTFCMCNPPFYQSHDELQAALESKEVDPSAACTGREYEMVTDGGEYGFIERIMNESLIYKDRIQWYTSLIGLKRSVWPLVNRLKELGITNYVVNEFIQGRTKRWVIAWSFSDKRVNNASSLDEYRPKSQFVTTVPKPVTHVRDELKSILSKLSIAYEHEDDVFKGDPHANTWSRAARRRLAKSQTIDKQADALFKFHIRLDSDTEEDCKITSSWVQGEDRNAFESFWSHVKKRIDESCGLNITR
ncbi:hypothetical protein BJV82DRAFT_398662 [Fennellomyces sp. T-0311]|nr:hypothetical protein BJV82DRAFT_398662 [Fennellomyces sp. T-0311]